MYHTSEELDALKELIAAGQSRCNTHQVDLAWKVLHEIREHSLTVEKENDAAYIMACLKGLQRPDPWGRYKPMQPEGYHIWLAPGIKYALYECNRCKMVHTTEAQFVVCLDHSGLKYYCRNCQEQEPDGCYGDHLAEPEEAALLNIR